MFSAQNLTKWWNIKILVEVLSWSVQELFVFTKTILIKTIHSYNREENKSFCGSLYLFSFLCLNFHILEFINKPSANAFWLILSCFCCLLIPSGRKRICQLWGFSATLDHLLFLSWCQPIGCLHWRLGSLRHFRQDWHAVWVNIIQHVYYLCTLEFLRFFTLYCPNCKWLKERKKTDLY